MSRGKLVSTIIALVVSVVFLWLAFSRIDFKALMATFASINWLWSIPFLVITWVTFYWRGVRWRLMLSPAHPELTSWGVFGPLMIGFGFNSVFPGRVGEIARPLALTKTKGVAFPTALSTVVLERVFDGIILLGLFLFALNYINLNNDQLKFKIDGVVIAGSVLQWVGVIGGVLLGLGLALAGGWYARRIQRENLSGVLMGVGAAIGLIVAVVSFVVIPAGWSWTMVPENEVTPQMLNKLVGGMIKIVAVLFVGALLFLVDPIRNFGVRVFMALPLVPKAIKDKVQGLVDSVAKGFVALRDPMLLGQIVLYSALVWVGTGLSMWVLAFGFPDFPLGVAYSMVFLTITAFFVMLPSSPGYWGPYEVGGMVALILCGVVPNTEEGKAVALGFTLVAHFVQWAMVTAIGLYYAGRIHLSTADVAKPVAGA